MATIAPTTSRPSGVAPALLALILGHLLAITSIATAQTVDAVSGTLQSPIAPGQQLAPGTPLDTGQGRMQVGLGGENLVRLGTDTQGSLDDKQDLQLDRGVALVNSERGVFKSVGVRTDQHKITAKGMLLIAYYPGEFLKVTCLTGSARVDLQAKFGEFVDLSEGDILITSPTDEKLPDLAKVDIAYQTESSSLINDPSLGTLPTDRLSRAIENQQRAFAKGTQEVTPLLIGTDNTLALDAVQLANIQARQRLAAEVTPAIAMADPPRRPRPGGGPAPTPEPEPSEFPPLPPGFQEVRLADSQSNFRDAGVSDPQMESSSSGPPPSLSNPNQLVLESPISQTLNPAGVYDLTALFRKYGAIGSRENLNIVSRVITTANGTRVIELFAGKNLSVGPDGQIDVSALERWEVEFFEGEPDSFFAGLVIRAGANLNISGRIRNSTGPVELIAEIQATLRDALISGVAQSPGVTINAPTVRMANTTINTAHTEIMTNQLVGDPAAPPNRVSGSLSISGQNPDGYSSGDLTLDNFQVRSGDATAPGATSHNISIYGRNIRIRNSTDIHLLSTALLSSLDIYANGDLEVNNSRIRHGSGGSTNLSSFGGNILVSNSQFGTNGLLSVRQQSMSGGIIHINNSSFNVGMLEIINQSPQGILRLSGNVDIYAASGINFGAPNVNVAPGANVNADGGGSFQLRTNNFQNDGAFRRNGDDVLQPTDSFPGGG